MITDADAEMIKQAICLSSGATFQWLLCTGII